MEKARFETHDDSGSPLTFYHQILTVSHDRMNWHENIELLYSIDGIGQVLYNADTIDYAPGDTIIINPYCSHVAVTNSKSELYCFIISNKFCKTNGLNIDSLRFEKKVCSDELGQLLTHLASIHQGKSLYKSTYTSGLVLQIAAYISENFSVHSNNYVLETEQNTRKNNVNKAMMYISANFNTRITLDDVCSFLNINKSYFTREFKYFTHMTFVNYINVLRCNYAKTLLRDPRYSISEIGDKCGFENIYYFSNVFKKHIGISPSEYKKSIML